MNNYRLSQICWPSNCSIECLTLDGDIHFDNLVRIFSCCPQLHRLTIKEALSCLIDFHPLTSSFPQLSWLIIEHMNVTIDRLESFLLSTRSLVYLKLLGKCEIFDGKRWEEFLSVNLPNLNRFEFDIICPRLTKPTREDLDLFIQSYRSSFWIEYKKWFVTVKMNENAYQYQIFSLPLCKSSHEYDFQMEKISLSTSDEISSRKEFDQMVTTWKMSLTESMFTSINIHPYLTNVTKLHLGMFRRFRINLVESFPRLVNLSQLVEVHLESFCFDKDNANLLCDMLTLLQQSSKLIILIIHSHIRLYDMYSSLESIFAALPRQIHHLKIPIKQAKQIEIILERCQRLTVVQFPTKPTRISTDITQWFEENTNDSIIRRTDQSYTVWIGEINQQSSFNNKRIKLNQEDFTF